MSPPAIAMSTNQGHVMSSCANCGRENPAGARFCNGCGKPLEVAPAPREQRKTVTILFCDVTGSTAMGELLDPESLRQVMRRYFDAARTVIEQHGGTVEKFIGDAVMAVFGVPVLHEDDALRAVRAAAGLRDALATLNEALQRDYATTVIVRTGVNTGPVVTGTEERLATGDAVNLAARLEQAAAPGDIIIGPETYRLVRDAVTVEPIAPLELKGKSLPVSAYRLLGITGVAGSAGDRVGATMVGRNTQLRMLNDAFANVIDGRACSLFTVLGAAGVGKSRLTAEFLRSVDATQVRGRCLSYGEGITYWPAIAIVRQLLDAPAGAGAVALMERDAAVSTPIKTMLGDTASTTTSTEIAWAVRKLLEAAAESKPLVVVFDDVHWGEPTLLDLIEHIGDFSRDAPILVLCLGRPELLDRRPGWGGGKLNATTVLLEPLNAVDTESLIEELLQSGGEIPADLRARLRITAAGNPLFVEEIVAMLRESGSHDVVVPPTIKALLAARFDQLRPEERGLLERGSIEGQSFHRGAVEDMAPDERDVAGRLMSLVRKDLLRPDRPVFAGEDAFTFRHLLIRDAAYDSLPKAERAELHARFADWLIQHGRDLEEFDEIAGYHLEQAYRYRAELGPVDELARSIATAAAERLQAAGRRALDRGDTTATINLLQRAELLLPHGEIAFALDGALMQALAMSGRLNDAIARAESAAERSDAAGLRIQALQARLVSVVWRTNLDPEAYENEMGALVDRARPDIERSGDQSALATLEVAAAFVEHYRGRFDASFEALMRARQHAKDADEPWMATNSRALGSAAVANGSIPFDDALVWFAREKQETHGFHAILAVWNAFVLAYCGEFADARSLFAETLAAMGERGLATGTAIVMQAAWQIETLAGDLNAAERAARQGVEQLEKLGERAWLSTSACQLGEALYALGRLEEAELWVRRGLELGGAGDILTQLLGLGIRAKLLARVGGFDEALGLAQQAVALAANTQAPMESAQAILALAEVLYLSGDIPGAFEQSRRAVALYESKRGPAGVAHVRRVEARWAELSPATG
jgi:class 3 adenylate cyclase/tetratricopeptide (TPR) repeat protein